MKLQLIVLLLLCAYTLTFRVALGDLGSKIGSNVSESSRPATSERFYLNTARPANCSGNITKFSYCYYGREDSEANVYLVLVALYRRVPGRNTYERLMNTVTITKRTPRLQVAEDEALQPEFSCDSFELGRSVPILAGDVIGACTFREDNFRQLDVVSFSDSGYHMPYDSAGDASCETGQLPLEVGSELELPGEGDPPRILHIFAEIFPEIPMTLQTAAPQTVGTTVATSEDVAGPQSPGATEASGTNRGIIIIAAGIIAAGIIIGLAVITATLVVVFVRTRTRKQDHSKSPSKSQQRFPKILSTNITSESTNKVKGNEERHMRVYQNYSSHYESIDSYSAISNEVQTQFCTCTEGGDSCRHSTIQDSNYQHEADIRRNTPRRDSHAYFSLEGPECTHYDDLLEMNKTQNLFADVRQFDEPARAEKDLYSQMELCGIREIDRSSIRITGHLGSGQFGSVNEGIWRADESRLVKVALKTLNQKNAEEDKVKFLQEAAIMAQFRHPNVVLLYGIVSKEEPITLVVHLEEKGDLGNYLITIRPNPGELPSPNLPNLLLSFSQHVALGMQYLSGKGFVHRDLAARNILVSKDNSCKIADFGLSRDLMNENYYVSKGGVIPIKWTAIEAIEEREYSTASDVWSYGCLLYEIWSLGHKPYHQFSNVEAVQFVKKGRRLSPPPGCSRTLYNLMIQCWNPRRSERPSFRSIHLSLLDNKQDVLSIPQDALETHEHAGILGSPLKFGEKMHEDLQTKYIEVDYYVIV